MYCVLEQEVRVATWNIASVNNNPFEYWVSHPDPAYNELMEGVQDFIDNPGQRSVDCVCEPEKSMAMLVDVCIGGGGTCLELHAYLSRALCSQSAAVVPQRSLVAQATPRARHKNPCLALQHLAVAERQD